MSIIPEDLLKALSCYKQSPEALCCAIVAVLRFHDLDQTRVIAESIEEPYAKTQALCDIAVLTKSIGDISRARESMDNLVDMPDEGAMQIREFRAWLCLINNDVEEARRILRKDYKPDVLEIVLEGISRPLESEPGGKFMPKDLAKMSANRIERLKRMISLKTPANILVIECGLIAETGNIDIAEQYLDSIPCTSEERDAYYPCLVTGLLRLGREQDARNIARLIINPEHRGNAYIDLYRWSRR